MSLDEIISITISRQTQSVSRAGFGTALVLGTHLNTINRVDTYNKSTFDTAMLADGYVTTDAIYKAVQTYFSQSPSPSTIAVGRIQASQVTITVDTEQDSTDYGISIESVAAGTVTDHVIDSGVSATPTSIASALAAAINAGAEAPNVTATPSGATVQIDLDGTDPMAVKLTSGATLMTRGAPAGTIEDADVALAAIQLVDDDWYAIVAVDRTQAQVEKIATWTEAKTKIFGTASADANIINTPDSSDTTTIAAVLKAGAFDRSFVIYSGLAATSYPEAAWFGRVLSLDPGSVNWAFKTLATIVPDALTATARGRIFDKNANSYEEISGVNITRYGTMGSGEYIDIIRGADWLEATMQAELYTLLVTQDKVPYTDKGLGSLEALVRAALEEGIDAGFISEITSITVPEVASISVVDKAAREVTGIEFAATLQGAVNKVTIQGVLTV